MNENRKENMTFFLIRIWRAVLSSRLVLVLASIVRDLGVEIGTKLGLADTDAESWCPQPRKELHSEAALAIITPSLDFLLRYNC